MGGGPRKKLSPGLSMTYPGPAEFFACKNHAEAVVLCHRNRMNYYIVDRKNAIHCSMEYPMPGLICLLCDTQKDKPVTYQYFLTVEGLHKEMDDRERDGDPPFPRRIRP